MTVGTAFPSADPSRDSGSWAAFNNGTAVAWATNADTYLSDSSDTTWVQSTALPAGQSAIITGALDNVVVGAGSAITRVRNVVRIANSGTWYANLVSNGTAFAYNATTTAAGTSTKAYAGGWVTPLQAFGATGTFSTANLNDTTFSLVSDSVALRYAQMRMEYDVVALPVVGTVTVSPFTTDRPTITWTYSDADGNAQASAIVKVFSSAQYSAGGFNAGTSTATYSTTVLSSSLSVVPDTPIGVNGLVFRAYVSAIADKDSVAVASAYANSTAGTLAFTAPGTPTLTLTWDNTNKRTQIAVAGSASPFRYTVTRGDGTVIGTALSTMDTSGTTTIFDYTMTRGTPVVYSATITTAATATSQLTSGTRLGTVTTQVATDWELRALDFPTTRVTTSAPVSGLTWTQYEGLTVFRPLGSNKPVVVAGDIGGDDGTVTFITKTQTQWETLKTIIETQGNLLLVSPFRDVAGNSEQWVIRLTSRDWVSDGVIGSPVKTVTTGFVETP
jgi:hypothetical protein